MSAAHKALLKDSPYRAAGQYDGADATGDAANDADVTSTQLRFDASVINMQVTLAAPLNTSDSRWADGTFALGALLSFNHSDDFDALMVYGADEFGNLSAIGVNQYGALCHVNASVNSNIVNLTADAACFHRPGAVAYSVIYGDIAAMAAGAESDQFDMVPDSGLSPTVSEPGGYYLLGKDGGVFAFGGAAFHGSTGNMRLNQPVVGMSTLPDGSGYRFVASDGGVFSFGDAQFFGSTGDMTLNKPVVGMASTPSGNGYWLVASDGGIFSFGDAAFYGSTGDLQLNKPIIGMIPTVTGEGYWLVASDGGIFTFGDAEFYGSTGDRILNQPITALGVTPQGKGYYLLAADGGLFAFGDAVFHGSGVNEIDGKATGLTVDKGGYRIADSTGGVYGFGPTYHYGDLIDLNVWPTHPIVGISAIDTTAGSVKTFVNE